MANAPQDTIGKYRILAALGGGSQGAVYRARDETLGREVALKVLHPHLATPDLVERFRREARIIASIPHPNIAGISEIGESGGYHYIAVEYVSHSLAELIERGPLDATLAASVAYQTALALEEARASENAITHHDVKPDNILLTALDANAVVKLIDFGIAHAEGMTSITQEGSQWGTPLYMPPEQWAGERGDTRSDIYSLGVVLYHMLAGRPPFDSDAANNVVKQTEIARQHQQTAAPPLRSVRGDVSEALDAVVAKCMAKSPSERYQTPGELAGALAAMFGFAALDAPPTESIPPVQASRTRRAPSSRPPRPSPLFDKLPPSLRNRLPLIAAGFGALIVAVLALLVVSQSGDSPPDLPPRVVVVPPPTSAPTAPPRAASGFAPAPAATPYSAQPTSALASAPVFTPTPYPIQLAHTPAPTSAPLPTPTPYPIQPTYTPLPPPTPTPTPYPLQPTYTPLPTSTPLPTNTPSPAPVAVLTPAPIPVATWAPTPAKGDADIRANPAYGGTLRLVTSRDPGPKWDMCEFRNQSYLTYSVENLLFGDYNKGPSGSGETTFLPVLGFGTDKLAAGAMADYWEIPDPLTYSFRLREGLKWQDKHPTYGRAVNVDEMVTELQRIVECRYPRHDFVDSITGDDADGDGVNDTITYHTTQPQSFWGYEFAWGPYFIVAPPETLQLGTDDPWNQSGTGPWMTVRDGYVAASRIEFEKNPDWWHTYTAPNGREYALPFMDKVVEIIVPEEATRLAMFQTGNIDKLRSVRTSDHPAIERVNPDIGKVKPIEGAHIFWMPMNKPPFDDLRVRRAMNMAIDRQHFCNMLFEGDCEPLAFPLTPEWPLHYETLAEMPASVREYFRYNPQKAGELLDEAGYEVDADGTRFQIDMIIRNNRQLELEAARIAVGFWDDIGVKVTLDIVDAPVIQSRLFEKQYDFMSNQLVGRPNGLNDFRAGHQWNRSNLNDRVWQELWENVLTSTQADVQINNIKIATRAFLELAPHVQVPAGFGGDYWQPWVQNHNGERVLAFVDYASKWAYVWLE